MAYRNLNIIVGTSTGDMISMMRRNAVPWSQCDGSLLMEYVLAYNQGPRIYRVIQDPGSVPFTIEINLPVNNQLCNPLYVGGPDITLQAAQAILQSSFNMTTGPVPVLPSIQRLGFNGSCGPTYSYGRYGSFAAGQNEALTDGSTDPRFVGSFLPYNSDPSQVCISMLSAAQPDSGTRDMSEDQCAQFYIGNPTQQSEGIITYENADPDSSRTVETLLFKSDLLSECEGARYNLSMDLVLPQIAVDFEGEKNFLVSSAEVKFHLDGVAANAASVLAVEAALATSGIVVARMIARSSFYRHRRLGSAYARASAIIIASVVLTIFNIPNFALISRSLSNHEKQAVFTQVSVHNYRPSNFSAVLRAETHTFVTVQGSRATAVIGLLLYSVTLLLCLYLTWTEFTEIIHRREAAESRLGQDALIVDKDLLVQWRAADSLVYDTLHPKKVVEMARDRELEIMRLNLAHAATANAVQSPRGNMPGVRLPSSEQHHGRSVRDMSRNGRNDVPDLYQEV